MSKAPKGLAELGSRRPTARGPVAGHKPEITAVLQRAGGSLPQGYARPSLPRAAYSHSASVGSRLFLNAQYAVA
jgi:hypothetical protein